MFRREKLSVVLSLVVLGAVMLSACAPAAPTPTPKVVEKVVKETSVVVVTATPPPAAPADEVVVGLIVPLSGSMATSGNGCRIAAEVGADIVNNVYPELAALGVPFAGEEGIPGLNGAKIKLVVGDDEGVPEKALAETERMITEEGAHLFVSSYSSACAATASQVAERLGIPYIAPTVTAPDLTERGYKTFFRLSPTDDLCAKNILAFLADLNEKYDAGITRVASLYENTLFGSQSDEAIKKYAPEYGFEVVASVAYPKETAELTSEIQTLKAANPQVLIPTSYVSDALLTMRTLKDLNVNLDGIVAQGGGYFQATWQDTVGADGDYVFCRDNFSPDLMLTKPAVEKINDELYQPRRALPMDSGAARFIDAVLLAADAINRAGSLEPEALLQALRETDITNENLLLPWDGIAFDEKGQNIRAKMLMLQFKDGRYWTVWPWEVSVVGMEGYCPLDDIVWPMPPWSER